MLAFNIALSSLLVSGLATNTASAQDGEWEVKAWKKVRGEGGVIKLIGSEAVSCQACLVLFAAPSGADSALQ